MYNKLPTIFIYYQLFTILKKLWKCICIFKQTSKSWQIYLSKWTFLLLLCQEKAQEHLQISWRLVKQCLFSLSHPWERETLTCSKHWRWTAATLASWHESGPGLTARASSWNGVWAFVMTPCFLLYEDKHVLEQTRETESHDTCKTSHKVHWKSDTKNAFFTAKRQLFTCFICGDSFISMPVS